MPMPSDPTLIRMMARSKDEYFLLLNFYSLNPNLARNPAEWEKQAGLMLEEYRSYEE